MSFDCMLKYTEVKLELIGDYDMIMMLESGTWGGLAQAVKRYSKANNYLMKNDYDPESPDTWIIYLNVTNYIDPIHFQIKTIYRSK